MQVEKTIKHGNYTLQYTTSKLTHTLHVQAHKRANYDHLQCANKPALHLRYIPCN